MKTPNTTGAAPTRPSRTTLLLPVTLTGATPHQARRAAGVLARELASQVDYGLDALPDGLTVKVGRPAPSGAVTVDRAALARFLAAYDDLASLAGVVSCACDQADLPKAERGHDNEAHRCAMPADDAAIRRALEA